LRIDFIRLRLTRFCSVRFVRQGFIRIDCGRQCLVKFCLALLGKITKVKVLCSVRFFQVSLWAFVSRMKAALFCFVFRRVESCPV